MPKLTKLEEKIMDALLDWGVGKPISIPQLKSKIALAPDEQRQFERRLRDWRQKHGYNFPYDKKTDTYMLVSEKPAAPLQYDEGRISGTLRSLIYSRAHSRCAQCGSHAQEDEVKLVIDHRIPLSWGGKTEEENLWVLCEQCNIEKQNRYAHYDPKIMRSCIGYKSVHKRLGELLKAFEGKPVPHSLMEVVGQDEQWQRRARQLRDLPGWDFVVEMDNTQKKKHKYVYRLISYGPWPESISRAIKDAALARKKASEQKQTRKRKK